MAITPDSSIRLLKTPFEIDENNQLTFTTVTAQTNYFLGLSYIEEDNCSYQRKDNVIRFPAHIDTILEYNYVMYQNDNYTDKWFYAFITNMEYLNDNVTLISIETDTFQTWQFDIIYKNSFVEREHVNNDTIGLHTIPENLNIGEVICEQTSEDASYSISTGYWVGILSNYEIEDNSDGNEVLPSNRGKQFAGISVLNNTVFGNQLFLINIVNESSFSNLALFIARTNSDGHPTDIQNIFIIPNAVVPLASTLTLHTASFGGQSFNWYTAPKSTSIKTFNTTITKRTSFTGFTPKNKKCFVYPYNYLFVSNNQGSNNIFKYEDFSTTNCVFENQLSMSVGVSGKLLPKNYKNMTNCDDESLALGKYPTCAWSSDAYTNWLTQNSVNFATSVATSVGNIATGNANPINIASSIGNTIDKFYQASLLPNIEGGQATGDVTWGSGRTCFTFREMRAKTEYLQAIDDYFSMFGYKVNSVKIPNVTGRTNWNYVKTINCNLLGDIPQEDMQKIKSIFDKGITFWHNPTTFLDYSQSNTIVT